MFKAETKAKDTDVKAKAKDTDVKAKAKTFRIIADINCYNSISWNLATIFSILI